MVDYERIQKCVNDLLQKDLFFIFGYPKSGTTWVQHLLNGHPEIWCGGESLFTRFMPLLEQAAEQYNERVARINEHNQNNRNYAQFTDENLKYMFLSAVGLLFSNMVDDPRVKCIGDKSPEYLKSNELFADMFPAARFIHIIRDVRDVTVSGWFQNLRLYGAEYKTQCPDLRSYSELCASEWCAEIRNARAFERSHPERYLEVRYEDLHTDPEPTVRSMLEFLDVDASRSTVERCRQSGTFERVAQGRRPGEEERGSFFRKGIVGDWKNHFDHGVEQVVMKHSGELLQELGYV